MLDDKSPTLANLGNDHELIIKEYSGKWGSPEQSHESKKYFDGAKVDFSRVKRPI